ncbi:MAG: alpha-galactosidase [Pseudomonadota bacterium]
MKTLRLDDGQATLILALHGKGLPEPLYFGAPLPADDDMGLAHALTSAFSKGSFDALPPITLLPEEGRGSTAQPGLVATAPDGTRWLTAFTLTNTEATATTLCLDAADEAAELTLTLDLRLEDGLLKAATTLKNTSETRPLLVSTLMAPTLIIPPTFTRMLSFGGRWTGEFDATEVPLTQGAIVREARQGRTGHEHAPATIVMEETTGQNRGEAIGVQLAWSGGHRLIVEELSDGRRTVSFGKYLRQGECVLAPGEAIKTPTLIAAHSATGLSGITQRFHASIRRHIGTQRWPRPITCNSWEAVYFNHDLGRLKRLVDKAAALGAERFLLDDGWFKGRNDDTTSLGDWTVDPIKWPNGLTPLIDHVHEKGLEFGLWIEPEMINEESDLFRAHPDWRLADAAYPPVPGRHQFVLDLTNPAAFDHIFSAIDAILTKYPIGAIKWDHNRPLSAASAEGRPAAMRQTSAMLALMDALIAKHPTVEFESCAGGGGRIDGAVLTRAGRVWLSDSNDAVERMRLQSAASLLLPPEVVGSHVGPRVCHTSGRILPMTTRAWTAAARHMGFELDLAELTDEEEATLRAAVAWHKQNREVIHTGITSRLTVPEPDAYGELIALPDQSRFVAFASFVRAPTRTASKPLRLMGLDPDRRYEVRLANPEAINTMLTKTPAGIAKAPVTLSGRALMAAGVALPLHVPATVFVLEGRAV